MFYSLRFKPSVYVFFYRSSLAVTLLLTLLISGCNKQQSNGIAVFKIEDYHGKWVVLNYWAEWCGPCIDEIPELNKLQNEYQSQLNVLGVNFDRVEGDKLNQLKQQMGIQFANLDQDPADQLKLSRPAGLPTTYIFNRKGELKAKLVGPQTLNSILSHTDL